MLCQVCVSVKMCTTCFTICKSIFFAKRLLLISQSKSAYLNITHNVHPVFLDMAASKFLKAGRTDFN